jgi:hypothetical protein
LAKYLAKLDLMAAHKRLGDWREAARSGASLAFMDGRWAGFVQPQKLETKEPASLQILSA